MKSLSLTNPSGILKQLVPLMVLLALFAAATHAPTVAFALPLIPVVSFVVIAVHELGHVIAALATGQEVLLVSVDRAAWHVRYGYFVWDERVPTEDAGGWVACTPRAKRLDTPMRRTITSLGGPLADLAFAILIISLLNFTPAEPAPIMLPLQALLLITSFLSLIAFLRNIVPNGKRNDGQRILNHWREVAEDRDLHGIMYAQQALMCRVRLRDLPDWMLASPTCKHRNPDAERYLVMLNGARSLDLATVDAIESLRLLKEYRARFGEDEWSSLCLAFLFAVHFRDLESTRSLLANAEEFSKIPQMLHASQAALAMLEGKRDLAYSELWAMDKAVEALSPYNDETFADIRRRVEAIEPLSTPRVRNWIS